MLTLRSMKTVELNIATRGKVSLANGLAFPFGASATEAYEHLRASERRTGAYVSLQHTPIPTLYVFPDGEAGKGDYWRLVWHTHGIEISRFERQTSVFPHNRLAAADA